MLLESIGMPRLSKIPTKITDATKGYQIGNNLSGIRIVPIVVKASGNGSQRYQIAFLLPECN